jgi:hypothetical protein
MKSISHIAPRHSESRARGVGSGSPLLRFALLTLRRAHDPAGLAAPLSARRNLRWGDGRGTCPALPGLRHTGPSPWGAESRRGDVPPPLACPSCARGAALCAHSNHPSWVKQEPSNESSPASLCDSIAGPIEFRLNRVPQLLNLM